MNKHLTSPATSQDSNAKEWKFADLIADPVVRERWEQVRRYFYLRESTYDMTHRCNSVVRGVTISKGTNSIPRRFSILQLGEC